MALDIAIIGTGAIGGYYGARLAHAGHRVHFLLHTEYAAVAAQGLSVDSYLGDFSLKNPLIYPDMAAMPPCDLVCVAIKATANAEVFPQLAPLLKENTSILLLQNGFGHEQSLRELYPEHSIFAGLCFICSFREAPGKIKHVSYGRVSLAPLQAEDLALCRDWARVLAEAGVETLVIADLAEARWRKLVWNIPYNGLSVIMQCQTDRLVTDPAMRAAVRALMTEILEAAAVCGVTIEPEFIDAMEQQTEKMPPYDPSMRLDFLAGRPLEIEALYGNVIACAASQGYIMRYARLLQWQLEYLQNNR